MTPLQPVLFSTDPLIVRELGADPSPLVSAVVCDWERRGKPQRQAHAPSTIGTDTQISTDTVEDLRRAVDTTGVPVWCRINSVDGATSGEVDLALDSGVSEILIPMVRTPDVVEKVIDMVDGRATVGILIETEEAIHVIEELASLPVSRGYVGLMDLALGRGASSIFTPFLDGTLDKVRQRFPHHLGVAGLTVPGAGKPIPSRLLCGEMMRLGYDFSFMRRSFIRDSGGDPRDAVRSIISMISELARRTEADIARDHAAFRTLVADA